MIPWVFGYHAPAIDGLDEVGCSLSMDISSFRALQVQLVEDFENLIDVAFIQGNVPLVERVEDLIVATPVFLVNPMEYPRRWRWPCRIG